MKNPFSKKAAKEAKPVAPESPKVLTNDERTKAIEGILSEALTRIVLEHDAFVTKSDVTWSFTKEGASHSIALAYIRLAQNPAAKR